jgi:hypothetical protein
VRNATRFPFVAKEKMMLLRYLLVIKPVRESATKLARNRTSGAFVWFICSNVVLVCQQSKDPKEAVAKMGRGGNRMHCKIRIRPNL